MVAYTKLRWRLSNLIDQILKISTGINFFER